MDIGRKLEKLKVRYFPPGLLLEFIDEDGFVDNKSIDLLNLSQNSDVQYLVEQINLKEPLTIKYKSKIQRVIESK
jgi:dynein assembly factor with WDR repeat domains 1